MIQVQTRTQLDIVTLVFENLENLRDAKQLQPPQVQELFRRIQQEHTFDPADKDDQIFIPVLVSERLMNPDGTWQLPLIGQVANNFDFPPLNCGHN